MTRPALPFEPVLRRVGAAADRIGVEAYAVGGAVRDALLGRATTDLDVVAVGPGAGVALAEATARDVGARAPAVYPAFGTAAVTVPRPALERFLGGAEDVPERLVIEFVGARRESYRADSRKPIVEDGTLAEDLARRDFTVNALASSLNGDRFGEVVDPFGGLGDLEAGRLKTPLDPAETFADDPLRMFRAARFASQLGFEVVPEAVSAMEAQAGRVEILSQERVTDELSKLLASPSPSTGLGLLYRTGLLERVLPELTRLAGVEEAGGRAHKDNFWHTLEVVDNLVHLQRAVGVGERADGYDLWLRWAALLHDVGKYVTKRYERGAGWTFHGHEDVGPREIIPAVFRRLKLPLGDPLDFVQTVVRLHHRPAALVDEDVTDSAVRRLLMDAGDDVDDLMLLVRADVTSKNARRVRRYLAGFDRVERRFAEVEERDRMRNWQPPVDGDEMQERLGLGEGVAVGMLKAWVREAVLDGEVPNEHDAAWAYVLARKDEAVRRGALFDDALRTLSGPERAATGAVKEALFWDDLPADDDAARAHVAAIKAAALAARRAG
ncbi:HD domain-containing protein [Rubrivirga sp. S365]|uniref:CCA tRNA nucleotidyltransferase n=1 Tax=Rubrivirga sp. S365 TaxID=3076080 RepID=UPI0028C95004|nr:HD domain-containing protein [Rubrivirga sp. S365]MDT7856078.1 HD domain-containing protein [Rubrivirga sp. S365]